MDVKNYSDWHRVKLDINNKEIRAHATEREVWFCHLGANVGFEQDGKGDRYLRPMLIIKKTSPETYIAIPITKKFRNYPSYVRMPANSSKFDGYLILNQIRFIDGKRLAYHRMTIDKAQFAEIKNRLIDIIL